MNAWTYHYRNKDFELAEILGLDMTAIVKFDYEHGYEKDEEIVGYVCGLCDSENAWQIDSVNIQLDEWFQKQTD